MTKEKHGCVIEVEQNGIVYTKVNYTKEEEIANCVTHGLGALIYIGCFGYMLTLCFDWRTYLTAVLTCISAIAVYTTSTIYHAVSDTKTKFYLRKADHSDIPGLVIGCSASMCLLLSNDIYNYVAIGLSVFLWIVSVIMSIKNIEKYKAITITLNFVIGLLLFFVFIVNRNLILQEVKYLYLAGAILCIAGSIIFAFKVKFMHAIFHVFVVCGTLCLYVAAILTMKNYVPF